MNAKDMYAIANGLKPKKTWAPEIDRQVAAIRRIVGDQTPSAEFGTVDHVSGAWAYVKRAGQTATCKISIVGTLTLNPADKVLIERPHGRLNGAFTRTKV